MPSSARIDELLKKFDENPRRYFAPLANEYRKAGDLDQAIALCRAHLPQQPGHMSGHIVYGQALFEARQLDESRQVFEAALALDPENLIALRHLGDIARESGDVPTARGWYGRVLEADPRNDEVASVIAELETAPRAPTPARATAPVAAHPSLLDEDPLALEPAFAPDPELLALDEPLAGAASVAGAPDSYAPAPGASLIDLEPTSLSDAALAGDAAGHDMSVEVGLSPLPFQDLPTDAQLLDAAERVDALADSTGGELVIEPAAGALPGVGANAVPPSPPAEYAGYIADADRGELLSVETAGTSAEAGSINDEMGMLPVAGAFDFGAPPLLPPPIAPAAEMDALFGNSMADPVDDRQPRVTAQIDVEAMEFEPPPPGPSQAIPGLVLDDEPGLGIADPAPVSAAPFVTETMAELYLQQGFVEQAISVYRELVARSPDDPALRRRLAAVEAEEHRPSEPAAPVLADDFGSVESAAFTPPATHAEPAAAYASLDDLAPANVGRAAPSGQATQPTAREFFARLAAGGVAAGGVPDGTAAADADASHRGTREALLDAAPFAPAEDAGGDEPAGLADDAHDMSVELGLQPIPFQDAPDDVDLAAAAEREAASGAMPAGASELADPFAPGDDELAPEPPAQLSDTGYFQVPTFMPPAVPFEGAAPVAAAPTGEHDDWFDATPAAGDERAAVAVPAASRDGAVDRLFADRPANADDEAAADRFASAFALHDDENGGGEAPDGQRPAVSPRLDMTPAGGTPTIEHATRPASSELSLENVFREPAPRRPSSGARQSASFSFDQFFADAPAPTPAASHVTPPPSAPVAPVPAAPSSPAAEANDLEQFNAWLEGLKKK